MDMMFLTGSGFTLDFMAFVENLRYMGIGMVVIFVIISVIIGATSLVNYLFSE